MTKVREILGGVLGVALLATLFLLALLGHVAGELVWPLLCPTLLVLALLLPLGPIVDRNVDPPHDWNWR